MIGCYQKNSPTKMIGEMIDVKMIGQNKENFPIKMIDSKMIAQGSSNFL